MRSKNTLTLVCFMLYLALLIGTPEMAAHLRVRTFEFTYTAEVQHIPENAERVAIWLPYPVSDGHQEITDMRVSSAYPTTINKDPEYGNSVLYLSVDHPRGRAIRVEMKFRVKRREYIRRDFTTRRVKIESDSDPRLERWLQPDRLVPIDDHIRELAREVTRGRTSDLEKARAIYDYAVSTLSYDKSGTGWGRGDIYYACDVKRGNCTDFHALFIGFCRALGIPAKFAIGFPLPEERGQGQIAGYHCWAEFYLRGDGWVPVDASEAKKHPAKKEYFFGAHDENRLQLSIGRDIVLNPPQAGEPLNFFIYPYVEVDGKPFSEVRSKFYFKDLTSRQTVPRVDS